MSDYLGNLAARSLNLIEVIQPRLASRFEAPTAFDGPASTQHIGAEPMAEAPTVGETDLSLQTLVQPPARLLVEHPREASPSVPELQRLPIAAPQRTTDGLTARAVLSSAQPTRQQPSLPPQDHLPPVKIESAQPLSQRTSDPTLPASLQAPLPMLQPAVAQPSAESAPQQPDPDRSIRLLPAQRDGRGVTFLGRATEQESQPKLEPAPRPIVIERIALQQEPQPAGVRDGRGVALPRSAAPQEHRPTSPIAIQPLDFAGVTLPKELPPTDASLPQPPPILEAPFPTSAAIVARPQVVPYVKPTTPAPSPEPATTPEPAPTIQVTIGRIEVRATPPPGPAPRRQRTAAPVMSLDEYLRQRARGGAG